jgi:hypothetical protein
MLLNERSPLKETKMPTTRNDIAIGEIWCKSIKAEFIQSSMGCSTLIFQLLSLIFHNLISGMYPIQIHQKMRGRKDMLGCIHMPYGGKRMTDTAGTIHHEDL